MTALRWMASDGGSSIRMAAALLESAQVPGGLQVRKWMYFMVCCWILITSGFMVKIWKGTHRVYKI